MANGGIHDITVARLILINRPYEMHLIEDSKKHYYYIVDGEEGIYARLVSKEFFSALGNVSSQNWGFMDERKITKHDKK